MNMNGVYVALIKLGYAKYLLALSLRSISVLRTGISSLANKAEQPDLTSHALGITLFVSDRIRN